MQYARYKSTAGYAGLQSRGRAATGSGQGRKGRGRKATGSGQTRQDCRVRQNNNMLRAGQGRARQERVQDRAGLQGRGRTTAASEHGAKDRVVGQGTKAGHRGRAPRAGQHRVGQHRAGCQRKSGKHRRAQDGVGEADL